MADNLSPNLYLKERSSSAGAVAGVTASTYATCGWLRKGPVDEPQLVSSFGKFVEVYGTYWRNSYVPFCVWAFFQNEGTRAWINRKVPSDATKSANASSLDSVATPATYYTRKLTDPVITLDSTHNRIKVTIDTTTLEFDVTADVGVAGSYALSALVATIDSELDGLATPGTCTLEATVGGGNRLKFVSDTTGLTSIVKFEEAATFDCSKELLGLDLSGGAVTITGEGAIDWLAEAKWPGAAYDLDRMCLRGSPDYQDGHGGYTAFDVEMQEESAAGEADWETLESYEAVNLDDDTDDQFAPTVINEDTNLITVTEGATYGVPRGLQSYQRSNECAGEGDAILDSFSGTLLYPTVHEGSLTIVAGAITATDQGDGTLTGTGITSGTINYITGAWTLVYTAAPASGALLVAAYDSEPAETELCCQLASGSDGTGPLARSDVSDSALEATLEGIYAFNTVDEILNMSMPDFAGIVAVSNDLHAYATARKDRFIINSTAIGMTPVNVEKWIRNTAAYNTSYGALYYPWVKIADPIVDDGRALTIPPDGFVAGAFARTDNRVNVSKAPAGITDGILVGSIGLERNLTQSERDLLYPARVNCLISTPNTGRCIWGARTLSYNSEWKYVQVRRLFMYVEKAIYNSSFWTVFETNGPGLWSRIKAQGDGYLSNLFRDGYFAGEQPSDAFLVKVDADNNPPTAVDAGILTVDYFIAPNKPAEFVHLRFSQKIQALAA